MLEKLKGSVSYGMTVNRGNYNSERYDATLEFYPAEEKSAAAMDYLTAFDTVKKMVRAKAEIETEAP